MTPRLSPIAVLAILTATVVASTPACSSDGAPAGPDDSATLDGEGVGTRPPDGNGTKDGDETDVDCGGSQAPPCAPGKACLEASDCDSSVCADGVCQAPSPTDGVKNGDETDVDCGGSAPKCAVGQGCEKHEDCETSACAYNQKCIARRSCVRHHGGDTCGPADAQGDCCESITVPRPQAEGGPFTLDKYVVTAGRVRAMVEALNGNVRGWIQENRPDWFPQAWDKFLPSQLDDPENGSSGFDGVYQQLGPWTYYPEAAGNRGCNVEGPGARTFRVPDEINDRWGDRQRYSQDVLDEKPIVCITQYMMMAFCAWDGGRLPTGEEMTYAFRGGDENRKFPWGNSPAPAGWDNQYGFNPEGQGFGAKSPANGDLERANHRWNWWSPERRIDNDYTVYIAPPGRFPAGNGKFGHADLAGLAHQWTSEHSGTSGQFFRNGSWEAHAASAGLTTRNATAKYYAISGRCARD